METISSFFEFLNTTLGSDMFANASKVIASITPIFSAGFSIYVLLMVFNYYQKGIDVSIIDLSKQVMGWFVVIALALNASNYANIAAAIYKFPEEVSAWVTGTSLDANFFNQLTKSANEKISAIWAMIERASISGKIALGFAGATTSMMNYLLIFLLLAMYFVTKVSLALVLMFGPIFIGAMLFSSTRQYGMNWIGQCLNYGITIGLYAGIAVIQQKAMGLLKLDVKYTKGYWGGEYIIPNIKAVMEYNSALLLITILLIPLFLSVPSIASALTGGAGVSGGMKNVSTMSIAKSPLNATSRVAKVGFSVAKGGVNLARKALKK